MPNTKMPHSLTHATGAPVTDNVNILTAGPRGPALLQDIWLIEKLAHLIERLFRSGECTPKVPVHLAPSL